MCLAAPRLDTRSVKKHPNTKASLSSKHDLYTSGWGWAAGGRQRMASVRFEIQFSIRARPDIEGDVHR